MADKPPIDWNTVLEHARTPGHPGRRTAWGCIYDTHHEPVRVEVRSKLGPRHVADVDDVTQEVFVAADESLVRFSFSGEPVSSMRRWLFTIAHRIVVDGVRKGVRADARDAQLRPSMAQPEVDPTAARLVEQVLDALPEEDALLVRLFAIHDLSIPEIVPEIIAHRKLKGTYDGAPIKPEALKKRWQRLREKLFQHASGNLPEPDKDDR